VHAVVSTFWGALPRYAILGTANGQVLHVVDAEAVSKHSVISFSHCGRFQTLPLIAVQGP
jgi:hypothetical protein